MTMFRVVESITPTGTPLRTTDVRIRYVTIVEQIEPKDGAFRYRLTLLGGVSLEDWDGDDATLKRKRSRLLAMINELDRH